MIVYKRTNNPRNRFLVQENHSVGTLHDLLCRNIKNEIFTIGRRTIRDCAAATRYTVLQFLAIPQ
jgi:hypothetical protein